MSKRRLAGLTAVHVLLLVALLEVVINRVIVEMLRPVGAAPPDWHTSLDYAALFALHFAGALGALILGARCWQVITGGHDIRSRVAHVVVAIAAALAALLLVVDPGRGLTLAIELGFGVAVVAIVLSGIGRRADLGVQVGLVILAIPLLLHTAGVIGAFGWPEQAFHASLARGGVIALCLAALATPYCFAPRPFSRAVIRPVPVVLALVVAGAGAMLARSSYPSLAKAAALAIGVELTPGQPDPRLAMYLLAIATLVWTLTSCALATSSARRAVGMGVALIVLGGYDFDRPHHFLLPMLGLLMIADVARRVREEEVAALPIVSETPPVNDAAWAAYIALVTQGLRRALADVHSLTTRGEGGLASSVIVGDARGLPVRARIERIEGSVLALDVVIGREIDESRRATLSLWAMPPRALGVNPAGPPATPSFKTGDAQFDERFKARGSALAFRTLFDDGLRARAVATIDGWIAYWERESLRYRVYPGRGAPLDHPMPLSDLALGRASSTAERLITVVELLVELASRGVPPAAASDPPTARDPDAAASDPAAAPTTLSSDPGEHA